LLASIASALRAGDALSRMTSSLPSQASIPDPDLVLANVHAGRVKKGTWTQEVRAWPIRTPRAKLLDKYSIGTSAIFGHYVFHYPRQQPDRITCVDIEAADRLMGANIRAQHGRHEAVIDAGQSPELQSALGSIPVTATIDDPRHDDRVCAAITALCGPGVQLAIATKLLCIKRPALVPMMDSVVQGCFGAEAGPAEILRQFRRLLAEDPIATRIRELAEAVQRLTGFAPSPVRILDELIWFDWNLKPGGEGIQRVVGFEHWGYDPEHDERGVHWIGPHPDNHPRTAGRGLTAVDRP
jgi:hypothetical protein